MGLQERDYIGKQKNKPNKRIKTISELETEKKLKKLKYFQDSQKKNLWLMSFKVTALLGMIFIVIKLVLPDLA